ncbi:hypothetical protein BpHYR1_017201 [Brachionus plicatilis]|uniref:Uncharacterized protein n=1 Tax=Brachionus plicatilis TaxID=10195 RepID=A0A3M7R7I7_BRAPC|nr:hypothetical protein BpHYR1_017201 [Brachionus plicatilis]
MCLAHKNDKKQNEKAKLSGVSPKCGSSTKKRYEETGSVSDRSRSDKSGINRDKALFLERPHNSLLAYPYLLGLRINNGSPLNKGLYV